MVKYLSSLYVSICRFLRIHLFRNHFEREVLRWIRDKGDSTHRLQYPLAEASVVFDCGGYKGDWSAAIYSRYHPTIYIFEPVKLFYEEIVNRFLGNPKIQVFNFGLHNKTMSTTIMISEDASSLFIPQGTRESINLVDIREFIDKQNTSTIQLIKINIEGGEFDLLDRILDTGIIHFIDNLQIQFHHFVHNAKERRNGIRRRLELTHHLTYDYPFVWENWAKTHQVSE